VRSRQGGWPGSQRGARARHARERLEAPIFPASPFGTASPVPTTSSPRRSRMRRRPSGVMCAMRQPSGVTLLAPKRSDLLSRSR
jgi:hypothetical protein